MLTCKQDFIIYVKEEKDGGKKTKKDNISRLIEFTQITLPGLRIFNGSRAFLIDFIALMPESPNSSISNFFLPSPTPCSPVTVPQTRNDSLEIEYKNKET